MPLVLTVGKTGPFTLVGAIVSPVPETIIDKNWDDKETFFFKNEATFLLPMQVAARTPAGRQKLMLTASYVTCSDSICYPPKDITVALEINVGGAASPASSGLPAEALANSSGLATTGSAVSGAPGTRRSENTRATGGGAAGAGAVRRSRHGGVSRASTLGAYLGLAALMGALSLLTPCVFPMVPITVSYFTQSRAASDRRER